MRSLRGDADYQGFRASLEAQLGRWRDAVGSYEAAIVLSPGSVIYRRSLGFWLTWMRRYDEAEARLSECLEMSAGSEEDLARASSFPSGFTIADHTACLIDLGHVEWMRGDRPNAWGEVDDPYVQWELAMARGDYPRALDALGSLGQAAISQYRWYPHGLLTAWAYEGLGDDVRAREGYAAAVRTLEPKYEENPLDERYSHALGLAYAGLGRYAEAVEMATLATELLPPEEDRMRAPFHVFALAVVYARMGEKAEALAELERVLTMPARFSEASLREHYMLRPLHGDPEFLALLEREPGRIF
jgi:tetratricopeptide (TPR) repeat protein